MPATARSRVAVAGACLAVTFVVSMDTTTASVTGPAIARTLDASLAETQWLVNAFLLTFALLLVVNGSLASRLGDATLAGRGIVVFVAGAFLAAAAPSINSLLAFRAVEGVGAAAMLPCGVAIYRRLFEPERQHFALGIFFAVSAGGAAFGPIVAGALLTFTSWRVVFVLAGVIGLATLVGMSRATDEAPSDAERTNLLRVNVVLGVGLLALIWGLIRVGSRGWTDTAVLVALVLASIVLSALVVRAISQRGMLRADGFAVDTLGALIVAQVVVGGPAIGTIFLLSGLLERVRDMSAVGVGALILPFLATTALLSPLAGRLGDVISLRTQLVCGLAVQTFALLWLAAGSRGEGLIQIALPLVLMGVATALVVPALLNRFMDAAPVGRGALMGGINVSATQVGTLIGIALFGSILGAGLAPRFAGDLRAADSPVRATPARVARLASHGPDAAVANVVDPAIRARAVRAGKEAYVDATAHAINVAAAFSGASVLLLLILGGRLTPTAEGSRT